MHKIRRIGFKKLWLLLLPISVILIQCCNNKNRFEIEGTIINNPNNIKTLYLWYPTVGDSSVRDSVTITDNRFYYEGILTNPVARMSICTEPSFWMRYTFEPLIESGINTLSINLGNFDFTNHKGTPLQKEYELLRFVRNNYKKSDSLWLVQQNDTLASENIVLQRNQFQDSLESFNINYSKEFIRQHPNSYISLLAMPMVWYWGGDEGKVLVDSIFYQMPADLRNLPEGMHVEDIIEDERIKASQISDVGQPATDFTLTDINGNTVSLKDFKGKYLLIDFWASWCMPCRQDIPYVKEIYKKYKSKGLEILAISIDDDQDKWRQAVEKDGTSIFIQTNEPRANKKGKELMQRNYYIEGVPSKILINKEGIIIGRWYGQGEENENEIDNTLKENVK